MGFKFNSIIMRTKIAIGSATLYLVILTILGQSGAAPVVCAFIYLFSPVVIIAMVYLVLTEKGFSYPELAENEEWGYRDREKSNLGVF
jgi:hypothetical protein